jgi:hypothetical protein
MDRSLGDRSMMPSLLWLSLTWPVAADPGTLPLFAEQAWYKEAKQAEAVFVGTLEQNPSTGRAGKATRFNAFRLSWIDSAGKEGGRELYLPDKAVLLAEHLGERLRIVGKAVDVEADGNTYHEIWPAHLELPNAPMTTPMTPVARNGIVARCFWQPGGGLQREPRLLVFRSSDQLTGPLRLTGSGAADAASSLMAQKLGVAAIDWNKHLLVCVSAGLKGADAERLTVTRTEIKDKVLTVFYRLETPPGGAAGLGYPAETVLVERFEGEFRLQAEAP